MVVMHNIPLQQLNIREIQHFQGSVSFVDALKDKYVDQEVFDDKFSLPKDNSVSTEIRYVGFGRVSRVQRQLKKLRSIDLSNCNIRLAGEIHSFVGSLDNVTILNLANNLLTWIEIIKIVDCFPNLKELVLTSNELSTFQTDGLHRHPNQGLMSLVLGQTKLTWTSIIEITNQIWTTVDQLDLWSCGLATSSMELKLDAEAHRYIRSLKVLKLSCNPLSDLCWLDKAGPLNGLSEIDLSCCNLEVINLSPQAIELLQNVDFLNIAHNHIKSWKCITALNKLKKLRHLICHDNPILQEEFARHLILARLAGLKILNREEITCSQRRDSEILYLRKSYQEYKRHEQGDFKDFHLFYSRYIDLADIYGMPEDTSSKPLVDKYVTVNLIFEDTQILKKLPVDMRVSNLIALCRRLFKLKPYTNIKVLCKEDINTITYPLDQEGQTLHFFSVKDNQNLLILTQ